jgi:N,N-dimethylformamidase beta subunit-like protein
MPTATPHLSARRIALFAVVPALAAAALAGGLPFLPTATAGHHRVDPETLEGRAPTPEELRPSVEAAFGRQSYAPGGLARLTVFNRAHGIAVRLFHAGPEHTRTFGYSEMQGVPVTPTQHVGASRGGRVLTLRIGDWPSGLYFARLTSSDGRIGFAPFVVRPSRLGEHRVAVVLPTLTWQAYNLRDDNGDGHGDSWYASWDVHTVRLARPFLNRGVPYNFRRYDRPFLNWLAWTGHGADVLSDADLYHLRGGAQLARAYDLVIVPGHHEYVTTHEYDVVRRYRDLGGNLAFLSANNFFWRVQLHGNAMTKTQQWRDLGRPEASLIGVQYRGNDRGGRRAPWTIRHAEAAPWLFAGTGLKDGSKLSSGGIEIDKTAASSPRGTQVLAEISNLFGPGFTAQMTYYRSAAGAEVFAAGAFTLAGDVESNPVVSRLVSNLWAHMAPDAS